MSITEDLQMKKSQYLSRFLALGLYFKHIELMTVNLLSVTSVVRIHLLPPVKNPHCDQLCGFYLFFIIICRFINTTLLRQNPSPPKTVRRAELYNEKESQITPALSSVHPKTHTPITDIIIHQTDNMFKPGFIPRARQAAVVSKTRFYIPPALSGRRFIFIQP